MKPKKRTFTITRIGYFTTKKFSDFQCTIRGWETYQYELALTGSPKWDENGFLMDHNLLHQRILQYILKNKMQSCEIVLEQLCESIIEECKGKGVELKRLELTLSPADKNDLKLNDNNELVRVRHTNMFMPAFGKFICEF